MIAWNLESPNAFGWRYGYAATFLPAGTALARDLTECLARVLDPPASNGSGRQL